MAVLVIAQAPGATAEQDKAMMEALNLAGDPPAGAGSACRGHRTRVGETQPLGPRESSTLFSTTG